MAWLIAVAAAGSRTCRYDCAPALPTPKYPPGTRRVVRPGGRRDGDQATSDGGAIARARSYRSRAAAFFR